MINFEIDLVVPFVNNQDAVWKKVFIDYCNKTGQTSRLESINGPRYEDFGMFEYALKCIDRFMPWIKNIYLIVSNIEQVPDYINKTKTKIILHKDIIPYEYLPTFNSSGIEMFIVNIDGLSEHFIYTNDDMFPISPLSKEDFFTNDGKIKMNFSRKDIRNKNNQFRKVCLKDFNDVSNILNNKADGYTYLKPIHSMTPMIKSHCKKCLEQLGNTVYDNITAFRTEHNNNQYIYPLYEYLTNNATNSDIKFGYFSLKRNSEEIADILKQNKYQIVCLNDVDMLNRSHIQIDILKKTFDEILRKDI